MAAHESLRTLAEADREGDADPGEDAEGEQVLEEPEPGRSPDEGSSNAGSTT